MEAYIINGYRSAVAKSKRGGFKNFRSDDLAVEVVKPNFIDPENMRLKS